MDDKNISSNSGSDYNFNDFEDISSNAEEERDLFSYDNSENLIGNDDNTFDLNSFSSATEISKKTKAKKGTKTRRQKIIKAALTVFLVGLISVSLVVGAFLFYAFTMVDATMDEDLENSLNFTTTIYVDDGKGNYSEYRRLHGEFNRIWIDYDKVAIDKEWDGGAFGEN